MQLEMRIAGEDKTGQLGSRDAAGGVLFFIGVFCALWAQNTGRNPWLWFFIGVLANVAALIAVLIKNGDDKFNRQQRMRYTHGREEAPKAGTFG